MPRYEVKVNFDDSSAEQSQREKYFKLLDNYRANGIGHDNEGTSSIFVSAASQSDLENGLITDLKSIGLNPLDSRELHTRITSISRK